MERNRLLAMIFFALAAIHFSFPGWVQGADSKPSGRAEWTKTLEAAKKEGKLTVISGASSSDYIGFFRKAFPEIQVEFIELRAPDIQVRLPAERQAGVFAWDIVFLGGSTTT